MHSVTSTISQYVIAFCEYGTQGTALCVLDSKVSVILKSCYDALPCIALKEGMVNAAFVVFFVVRLEKRKQKVYAITRR